jgi:hypothetical protein
MIFIPPSSPPSSLLPPTHYRESIDCLCGLSACSVSTEPDPISALHISKSSHNEVHLLSSLRLTARPDGLFGLPVDAREEQIE